MGIQRRKKMSEQETSTKVSRAERFELVDNTGKVRAALSPDDDGGTSLKFHDHEGKARAVVGVDAAGHPSLTLLNAEELIQVALAFKAKGGSRPHSFR
jgi:hypothetical protein